MFEKIPSLKDFIIYFIPGVLTSYFGFCIFAHYIAEVKLTIQEVSSDTVLVFISILFSFIVGFLTSQLQIILFKKVLKRFVDNSIYQSSLYPSLKDLLIDKIIKKFSLTDSREALLKNPQVIELCLEYIKHKSTEEANSTLNRSKNMSTLAMVINVPIFLAVWNLLFVFHISGLPMFIVLILTIFGSIAASMRIAINFKKAWLEGIYRHFFIMK